MKDVLHLLESQRDAEREFVREAASEASYPRGWSAALLMAHIASWRNGLRDSLIQASRKQPVTGPPADIDTFNAMELASNADVSLDAAATRADTLLADLIDLWATLGDRPFKWFTANTTGEALVRNSYIHPRRHLSEHYEERGDQSRAAEIREETMAELHRAAAPESLLSVWK